MKLNQRQWTTSSPAVVGVDPASQISKHCVFSVTTPRQVGKSMAASTIVQQLRSQGGVVITPSPPLESLVSLPWHGF